MKRNYKINPRIAVFIFCLLISFLIWTLIAFSKIYTLKLKFKTEFIEYSEKKILLYNKPDSIEIEITTDGFTLFLLNKQLAGNSIILELNNEIIGERKSINNSINLNNQVSSISQQLGIESKLITKINPQYIYISNEVPFQKVVYVKPKLNVTFQDQFRQNGNLIFLPRKMIVSGPKNLLLKLDTIYTNTINASNLSNDLAGITELIIPSEYSQLYFPTHKVIYKLPIDRITEKEILVPVNIISSNNNYFIKPYPPKIKARVTVNASHFKVINENSIQVGYTVNNIDSISKCSTIPIFVTSADEKIVKVKLLTERVEFIIQKK